MALNQKRKLLNMTYSVTVEVYIVSHIFSMSNVANFSLSHPGFSVQAKKFDSCEQLLYKLSFDTNSMSKKINVPCLFQLTSWQEFMN